ncbi:16S rRNA (adenine(1518)-N(6)/adenine(1519)-N(6))-dimethyltransferase RsmA [Galbibacter pacificus]|uniref:Ribosomal RNA small subunit methyltransferase A n=1 Tax=Galbibacter pacificus TaxID=2996052 RepID=A0ABT6FTK0_9FLAO|nr:16S rRNA (adenine(1518)-N(6)/adenine(1519)-N(6))-dimethyltransferase RsmA [Galbibacter pacificus]MDG3582466.1 16S rRNA (adenine(1518)-N(6)/adenine(1519)-N(6))-dimethyltransferase RsmA [Galbibacter pacificus]MDG3586416.1 16S rRNA (adenine(1518)-N(6)/adenine(1519)-N(6))-dimethyltransferase RsmA [Galbibacter pacificus]
MKKKKKFGHKAAHRPSKQQEGTVRAKKHLGQHFLKDENIAQKIGDTLTLANYKQVLEIGPGMGVLTKYLLKKNIDVYAMDLDTESIAYLQQNFMLEHAGAANTKNVFKVIEGDFLKYDVSKIFGKEAFAITGNFPYNISSQIVFKALELRDQVPEFTGMFQKEVAERICEKKGNKTYGILSVLVQAFYRAEYLFTVSAEVFNPPPKVQSGVLRLSRKEDYTLPCNEKLFFRVVKAAFGQRRKTLRNSLKAFNLTDNLKEDIIFDRRPEQMSVEDFIALSVRIEKDIT